MSNESQVNEAAVNEQIEVFNKTLEGFNRKEQNLIILGVFGNILKERRNIIRNKKDEIEKVDKDTEDLRSEIVNVNSKILQNERSEP